MRMRFTSLATATSDRYQSMNSTKQRLATVPCLLLQRFYYYRGSNLGSERRDKKNQEIKCLDSIEIMQKRSQDFCAEVRILCAELSHLANIFSFL